jgi:hypothetical protein
LIRWLKNFVVASEQKALELWAWTVTSRFDRRLRTFYGALTGGTAMGVRKQPFRGADIIVQLRRHAPRSICELGSGSSTGVFAGYAERHDARAVVLEHDERWREVTLDALRTAGFDARKLEVIHSDTRVEERGVGYTMPVPDEVDFVYIDGPPAKDDAQRNFACIDVLEALERGTRPSAIMIDGREPTVTALLEHPVVQAEYEAVFARPTGGRPSRSGLPSWRESLRFRPHHIFTLRNGGPRA